MGGVLGQKESRRNPLSPRALASAARRKLLPAPFHYLFFSPKFIVGTALTRAVLD